ncbi:hypothetical protein PO909_014954 [Leuciscus waleckii]
MVFDTGMDDYDSDYYNLDACMDDDDLDCPEYCVAAFGSTHFSTSNHDRMTPSSSGSSSMNLLQAFAFVARQREEAMTLRFPKDFSSNDGESFRGERLARFSGTRGARRGGSGRGESRTQSLLRSSFDHGSVIHRPEHPSPWVLSRPEPAPRQEGRRRRKTSSVSVPVVPSPVVPSPVVPVPVIPSLVVPVPVVSSPVVRRRRRRKTSCLPNVPEAVPSEQPAVVPEAVPSEQPAVIPEIVSESPTISPATAKRVVFLFYAVVVLEEAQDVCRSRDCS